MFRGVNNLSLDAKGRLAVPTRYREALARQSNGQTVLTVSVMGDDPCLWLYPLPEWEEIERKLSRLPSFNKQAMWLQRRLLGHASECDLDGAGRILLPPELREFAKLDKEVVLVGLGKKFEIWSQAAWNAQRAESLTAGAGEGPMPPEIEQLSL
jgi:MraZ protein